MALLAPATRRVRQDFLPTWGNYGGLTVLTMEPYAFPSVRDLVYLPDDGAISRPTWGLVADLASSLQARAHVILGAVDPQTLAKAYNQLVASWFEKPGAIVIAGEADQAETVAALVADKPDFVVPIPDFMRHSFLPKTGEAKRAISKQVWGD